MLIAASLLQLLEKHKLSYRVLQHMRLEDSRLVAKVLNIDPQALLTVHILIDYQGPLMVVIPGNRGLDLARCNQMLKRDLKVLPHLEVNRLFKDCEAGSWVAVGQPYNLEIVLDKSIQTLDKVYFASGSHTATVQMPSAQYFILNARAKVLSISTELITESPTERVQHNDMHGLQFPPMPEVALQLLQLSMRTQSASELAALVANDQMMQQQIMLYAQLPFIQAKYQSESAHVQVDNMQAVVEHLLGFETVSHIALGVAVGRAFDRSRIGDLEEFWRHAFYAAVYAQHITNLVPKELQLDPAISYMAGLFHNFGLLLFGQMYPPEYSLLKKWLLLQPKVDITILEQRLLGMGQAFNVVREGHAQLGEWLLRSWQMPEAICVITKEHHNQQYNGPYVHYVRIIQLTNQLLRLLGIGDGTTNGISTDLVNALGLNIQQLYQSLEPLQIGAASLDNMARTLTNSK